MHCFHDVIYVPKKYAAINFTKQKPKRGKRINSRENLKTYIEEYVMYEKLCMY